MALTTGTPTHIVLSSIEANRWEIGYYRVDNEIGVAGGTTLVVQLYAIRQTGPATFPQLESLPLQSYRGSILAGILDRAGALFELYRGQGADLKTAYYLATRDAIYEQLKSDGLIPDNAS